MSRKKSAEYNILTNAATLAAYNNLYPHIPLTASVASTITSTAPNNTMISPYASADA